MLDAAHAAMFFWRMVGSDRQRAHAELLLAHVYAFAGEVVPATRYLGRARLVLEASETAPWERALVHAVAANVAFAAGDARLHAEHHQAAAHAVAALTDAEDRAILQATLDVLPSPEQRS